MPFTRHAVVRIGCVLTCLLAFGVMVGSQGQVMPPPKFTALDANGDPCAGCKLYAYAAGTTTPQDTYTSSALSTPNANPVVLDAAGRATVFLSSALSYKFVLKTSADVDIWTVDNVIGPFAGVVTVNVGNTRGIQVSRAGAEAGISVASTGGSGKTFGMLSNTSGEMRLQDDADGIPRMVYAGDTVSWVTTDGVLSYASGGILTNSGFGSHVFSATGTGVNRFIVRNSGAGNSNYAALDLGNDTTAVAGRLYQTASGYSPSGYVLADALHLESVNAGGLSIAASNAAGDIRMYAGGSSTAAMTIDQDGNTTINRLVTTTASPGAGTTHNYDIGGASAIVYYNGLSAATVTGITNGTAGRQIWVIKSPGSAGDITLSHESGSSTAANRFTSLTGADITVTGSKAVQLIYDANTSRWLMWDTK